MGYPYGKVSGLIASILILTAPGDAARLKNDEQGLGEDMKGGGLRMPYYDREQLEFIITSQEIEKTGVLIDAKMPVIDMIRPDADVDAIEYMEALEPYKLTDQPRTVLDFWLNRPYSDALISADSAQIDQPSQTAAGSGRLYLRSPILDLNGVGFLVDYPNRTALVRSQVEMTIRYEVRDTADLAAKAQAAGGPENLAVLRVTADSLLIDMVKNEIVLEGNVVLREPRLNHLTCDRMIITLDDQGSGAAVAEAAGPETRADRLEREGAAFGGVKRIVGIGNVEIDRMVPPEEQADAPQRIRAGNMVYDVLKEQFVFTENQPTMQRGADNIRGERIVLFKDELRAQVFEACRLESRLPEGEGVAAQPTIITSNYMEMDYPNNVGRITGDVRIDDIRLDLACDDMTILLADNTPGGGAPAAPAPSANVVGGLTAAGTLPDTAGKEVVEIICVGNVNVTRKDGAPGLRESAEAGKAVYSCKEGRIVLSDGTPKLIRGQDSISGRTMTIVLPEERLTIDQDTRIVLDNWRKEAAAAQTVITADASDLNYGGNHLTFSGSVVVTDPMLKLDCDDMQIYLEGEANAPATAPQPQQALLAPETALSSGKRLSKIVCEGNVKLSENRADLDTEKLTLIFREKTGSEAVADSPTGRTEIDEIFCDGGVKIVAKDLGNMTPAGGAPAKTADGDALDALGNPLGALSGAAGGLRSGILTAQRGQLNIPKNIGEFHGDVVVTDTVGTTMKSDDLYLIGRDIPAGDVIAPLEAGADGEMPTRLALTDGKELMQIIAENNVVIDNVDQKNGRQLAHARKAVYEVAERSVVLTEEAPKRASIIQYNEKRKVLGGRIIYYLDTGDAKITERMLQVPFDGKPEAQK